MKFKLFIVLLLPLAGCTTKLDLRPTVQSIHQLESSAESVAYHIPADDKNYVFNGQIFLSPLKVNYGQALTAKLKNYLEDRFEIVTPIDTFPPTDNPHKSMMVSFGDVLVKPGSATFASSYAKVELIITVYNPQTRQTQESRVVGESKVSPGSAGATPVPGVNDNAYNAALRAASNDALDNAIAQLFDHISSL